MGHLGSCVEKIRRVRFEPIPTVPIGKIVKIVRIPERGTIFALRNNGDVLTDGQMTTKAVYCGTGSDDPAVKALVLLGIITEAEAKQHGKEKAAKDRECARYRAAFHAAKELEESGIELTASQKTKLARFRCKLIVDNLPYFMHEEAKKLVAEYKAKKGKKRHG